MRKSKINNHIFNITGKNIKIIRKNKKITQEDLCARMQILGIKLVVLIYLSWRIKKNL